MYEDFIILATDPKTVKQAGRKVIHFNVQVPHAYVGELTDPIATQYDVLQWRKLKKSLDVGDVTWDTVFAVGVLLEEALLPGVVKQLLQQNLDRVRQEEKRLRLRLKLSGELNNLPWEFILLNRGGGEVKQTDFLALMPDVSVMRHRAMPVAATRTKAELPTQILIVAANPNGQNLAPLNVDEELRLVQEAVKENPYIETIVKSPATPENILEDDEQAHLFHYIGHGDFPLDMSEEFGKYEGRGLVYLEDAYGDVAELSTDELAVRLRSKGVRVAVVGACKTAQRDDINGWSSAADALVKAELGAVVGMQYPIRDDSAIRFGTEFYKALVAGLTIDEAVTNGRIAIASTRNDAPSDVRGWATPVLHLRSPDGVIFPEHRNNPQLNHYREQVNVNVKQLTKILHGKQIGAKIKILTDGSVNVEQVTGVIAIGAEQIGFEADTVGGSSSIDVTQKSDEVRGKKTGVVIDNF